jgi:hypothetical protein
VAILGSVLSGVYRDRIAASTAGLPGPQHDLATSSVSGTYTVAGGLGAGGRSLIAAGNEAFVAAMHWAAAGSVLVGLVGTAVVLGWLPRRAVVNAPAPTAAESLAEEFELADA